jgi:hypothetical protein
VFFFAEHGFFGSEPLNQGQAGRDSALLLPLTATSGLCFTGQEIAAEREAWKFILSGPAFYSGCLWILFCLGIYFMLQAQQLMLPVQQLVLQAQQHKTLRGRRKNESAYSIICQSLKDVKNKPLLLAEQRNLHTFAVS